LIGAVPVSASVNTDIIYYPGEVVVYSCHHNMVGVFGVNSDVGFGLIGQASTVLGDQDIAAELGCRTAIWN
jgi:hypothetical protein